MEYNISIYLDTRRVLKNTLYPVKLRVYSSTLKKNKLYPTIFEYSENDFHSIWKTEKPRKIHQEARLELKAIETKANEVAKEIKPFSFEQFEKKLYRKSGEGENVFYQYQLMIDKNLKAGSLGNSDIYRLSLKSIKDYLFQASGKEPSKLLFREITPSWLKNYEAFMLNDKKRSRTTVSMYTRALRAIFNEAIRENEVAFEIYPFGKNKYRIPNVRNTKKSLTKEQLKHLFEAKPQTPEQEKAKDFWFFSYACNGMNIKDVASIRYENLDLDNEILTYYRAKTINTSDEITPIIVYLNDFSLSIIKKYGAPERNKKQLIFSIISDKQGGAEKQRSIKNFTRFINQNLKKLARSIGLPDDISTYWARHSFATNLIRSGASMEFASEALNHSDLKTTKRYFSGFEEETKKALLKNMMDF